MRGATHRGLKILFLSALNELKEIYIVSENKYVSEFGGFSINFPTEPMVKSDEKYTSRTNTLLKYTFFTSEDSVYVVMVSGLPMESNLLEDVYYESNVKGLNNVR